MKKPIKKTAVPFEATLIVMGRRFKAKGKTIFDAINKLEPGTVAGKGILTIQHGKAMKDRVIPHTSLKRTFNMSVMSREVGIKSLSLMFEGI